MIVDVVQTCPKCQSTNATHHEVKFQVNICGHSICQKCFELMFQKNEDQCPKCDLKLLKVNFRPRTFESDEVESYMSFHKQVKKIYNCDDRDFGSVEEYNDYLEYVETLINELMDVSKRDDARSVMNEYYNSHKNDIKRRRNRKSRDEEEYERMDRRREERRALVDDAMRQEKEEREQMETELGRRLLAGNEPVQDVVRQFSRIVDEKSSRNATARVDAMHQLRPYRYETPSYMARGAFRYDPLQSPRTAANDSREARILLQTLKKPVDGLPRGGGYTPDFWLFRLRYFCSQ